MHRAHIRPAFAWLALLAAVAGCATWSERKLERALVAAMVGVDGLPPESRIVPVYAGSEMDAWAAVAQSAGAGASDLSRTLAHAFDRGASAEVGYVIGGPYAHLNERVLLDAFALAREPAIPGLFVLYVSPEPPTAEILAAVRAVDARIEHRPLEPPG